MDPVSALPRSRVPHRCYGQQFSDDASLVEAAGGKIILIPGNPNNIKITYQHDILVAESLLGKEE